MKRSWTDKNISMCEFVQQRIKVSVCVKEINQVCVCVCERGRRGVGVGG